MDREKEKKLVLLFFLWILLWQLVFNFILFPQRFFLKYPINASRFFSKLEPSERFLDFSPLYLFINGILSLFSQKAYLLLPYFQIGISLLGLYFLFKWAREKVSPAAAYTTVFLGSLYPSYLLYLNCLEPEALLVFTIISGFSFLLMEKNPLTTGIFFSLSILLRPSFLPVALLVFFFIKRKKILYLAPIFFSIIALLIFSYWATGFFTLSFMSPGTVFYEGNNPQATGVAAVYPKAIKIWEGEFTGKEADYAHKLYRKVANFEKGKENSLMENQFFWIGKAFNYIMDYPSLWLFHFVKKIWFYFSSGEAHDIFAIILINNKLGILKFFSFSIFSSLALLGLLFFFKNIKKILVLSFFLNIIILALFYFSSRQRMTLFALCLFLCVYGIEVIKKNYKVLLILIPLLIFFGIKPPEVKNFEKTFMEVHEAGAFREAATKAMEENKMIEASQFLSISIAKAPYLSYIHCKPYLPFYGGTPYKQALNIKIDLDNFSKGLLLFYDGNNRDALSVFEKIKLKKIVKHYYNQDLPIYYYIISLLREKREKEAMEYLKIAKEKYPSYLSIISLDYLMGGKYDLLRYYDILSVNFKLAETAFYLKDFKNALKYSKRVIEIAPEMLYIHEISSISNAYLGNFREMAEELNFILPRKAVLVYHREWQDISEKLENKFGSSPDYTEFLNHLRALFPKPPE
ncbi:MAG: hypothetical protein WHV67_02170 [Thermoanaerobaculia bacterium]